MDAHRYDIGAAALWWVPDENVELRLPLPAADVEVLRPHADWLVPRFADDDFVFRVASAAIVVRVDRHVVVIDPWTAFDDAGRDAGRWLTALAAIGIDAGDVDVVVNTHAEGVGANTAPGDADTEEVPTFTNARYVFPAGAADALAQMSLSAWLGDVVELVEPGAAIAPGIVLDDAPGHAAGHAAVRIRSGSDEAVVVGHLFLHPAQIFAVENTALDADAAQVVTTRRRVLDECARNGTLLIGPLFAEPGAGRVTRLDGDRYRFDAVSTTTGIGRDVRA